ncbi:MAG TPA: M23 family metallopeptidase [Candidatus Limnocylindrales bacterium]|nr:M23 family metallopeptidase [Candidatus Limnocylindrales bacterium]
MPDPQRPLRGLTHARSLSRAVTHVAVIGLVAFASAVGIAEARGQAPGSADSTTDLLPFDLVSRARGAPAASQAGRSSSFELRADPNQPDPLARRDMQALSTPLPTALPTPVAPPAPAPDLPMAVAAPVSAPTVRGTGVLGWPVPGGSITTYFSSAHPAIDIAAPYGSTVIAADSGVVIWAGWRNNGGGLVVAVDHGNGISSVYNHLGSIWVAPGQVVSKGEGIAAVGCTGICTGPHVHLETIVGGVLVNPLRYL